MRDEVSFPRGENPNWRKVWTELLILWAVFALLGTWLNYGFQAARGHPISWTQAIRMNVSAYAIWAFVLTPIVLFLCARLPLDRKAMASVETDGGWRAECQWSGDGSGTRSATLPGSFAPRVRVLSARQTARRCREGTVPVADNDREVEWFPALAAGSEDYSGADVKGRIVALLDGAPGSLQNELRAHVANQEKLRALRQNSKWIGLRHSQ
jgi:hypothetical protein